MKKKFPSKRIDEKELKKRRRELIIIVVVGILTIVFTLISSTFFNKYNLPLSTNIFVFGLTSINFILIVLETLSNSFTSIAGELLAPN